MTARNHHPLRTLIMVLVMLGLGRTCVSACSTVVLTMRMSLDPNSLVFVGHVLNYVEPSSIDYCGGEPGGAAFSGILVSVDQAFAGADVKEAVEVYPYGLGASCGPLPQSIDQLEREFPRGSQVRVVGERENPCPGATPAPGHGGIRLFASTGFGGVARVMPGDPDPLSSQPYDYSNVDIRTLWLGDAVNFEIAKDLIRLEAATSERDQISILARLRVVYREWCMTRKSESGDPAARGLMQVCRYIESEEAK